MFLKKIEISGFKSFANKTTLDFLMGSESGKEKGITAIVGPNGSGKSNIADALRWVIGEQSMKNLRSKKSQDIIFAGSHKKARLGSASVTLYLDNSEKKLPLDFQEVSISRKLFRSGESEYSINGSRVRLQDIVDILAKAGIGKGSFTIVNQGMADSVLNATSLERRTIIEDAAGVKQYQIKKERSLRKLELTRQNLEKVKSLTQEIRPHLNLLKRQASKAAQSETVGRELKEKQNKLYSFLWYNFQTEKETLMENKNNFGRVMMNTQREVDKLIDEVNQESKHNTDNKEQLKLEAKLKEKRNQLNQIERDLMIVEGRVEIEKEKQKSMKIIEEIKTRSIPIDLQYVRTGLENIRKEQQKLIERLKSVEKLEDLQDIREFAQVIQQKLFTLKSDIKKGKKEEKIKPVPLVVNKISNNSQIIKQLLKKIGIFQKQKEEFEKQIVQLNLVIQKELEVSRLSRQKFFEIERNLRSKQDELSKLKDQFNDSKIVLARIETREDDLKNKIRQELRKGTNELKPPKNKINQTELENKIVKLKIKMEQIGGIDPLVIDEYKEVSERFEFLTSESQDLEKAIISLKSVIKEMDQKIEKEFLKAYKEINREFSEYFKIIFGGGRANLAQIKIKNKRLNKKKDLAEEELGELDEEEIKKEDEAEIGIEISACPPGKKITNLSMLSGGERSLTSIALLFAIIAYNPPPFAILDEVEAALDEANSKRFGRILQELSQKTQFITISHNRETMRQAKVLYGVTMGENGVSKLLSVCLDQIGVEGKIKTKD